jgi:hypothetical protein
VRYSLAHIRLRQNHVVGAGSLHYAPMLASAGLGPDVGNAKLAQGERGQHAGLDVGADAHHRALELGEPELPKCLGVAGVGLHHMGQPIAHRLDQPGVLVDAENLMSEVN